MIDRSKSAAMEWGDPKPPPQWDWDGLAAFDPKNMIQSQPPLEFWGLDSGPLYSPDDLGQGYSSKSSISVSTESVKELVRTEETKESGKVDESSGGSSEAVVSVCSGSGDPRIGLKLGKRTYFEDLSAGSEAKTSGVSQVPSRSVPTPAKKKARASQQGSQLTRCQVEGCNLDLTGAKEYHKKHKVCESHSKCPRVVVLGREKRFCQQCSRFHDLSEFDQKKRSCRRRLSDHNARRRKPPPEMISFTSARSSSLFYDDPRQINFLWNRSPFSYPGSNASNTWGSSSEFRGPHAGDFSIRSEKLGVASGSQRCLPINELSLPFPVIQHDIDRLSPLKGTAIEIVSKGMDATTVASQMNGAPDIRRALSLLSNETWGLDSPEPRSVLNQVHTNNTGVHYSEIQSNPEDWVADLPLLHNSRKPPFTLYTSASRYQEFPLLRPVHGTASFDQNHMHLSSE